MQRDSFDIRSFPDLKRYKPKGKPRRKVRVCIATEEIMGPSLNGGIASTYFHLALSLAARDYEVTVLYLKGQFVEKESIEYWIEYFKGVGVEFVPLESETSALAGPAIGWQDRYYAFYNWLKSRQPFDIVHTSEWRGGAFYVLAAKRLGLAFHDTLFFVKASSPYIWNRHYQMRSFEDLGLTVCSFAEQKCIEWADIVIGGSAHLLTFMDHIGYELPRGRTYVQPNILDFSDIHVEDGRPAYSTGERVQSDELVFFGRLEARKGLDIFCDAIERLQDNQTLPRKVTFLGRRGVRLPTHPELTAIEYIEQRTKDWRCETEIIEGYDQPEALSYLCAEPRIAVMPSIIENSTMAVYEALVHKIPFIASKVGGTPELVSPAHWDEVLTEPHPEPLAAALGRVLREGGTVAEAAFDNEENVSTWYAFHEFVGKALSEGSAASTLEALTYQGAATSGGPAHTLSETGKAAATRRDEPGTPSLAICLYHCDDVTGLERSLASLSEQTEPPDEVIVVTDGPLAEEDETRYEELVARQEPGPFRWKFLRQPHRCLGAGYDAATRNSSADVLFFMRAGQHVAKPDLIQVLRRVFGLFGGDACTSFFDRIGTEADSNAETLRVLPIGGDLCSHFFAQGVLGGKAFAVRREAIEALGGFKSAYHVEGVEEEFLARLVFAGRELQTIPEVLYEDTPSANRIKYNKLSGNYLSIEPYLDSESLYYRRLFSYGRHLAYNGTARGDFSSTPTFRPEVPGTWFVTASNRQQSPSRQPAMLVSLDAKRGEFHIAAEKSRFWDTESPCLEVYLNGKLSETLELRPLTESYHGAIWSYQPPTPGRGGQQIRFAMDAIGLARELRVRYVSETAATLTSYGAPLQELGDIYADVVARVGVPKEWYVRHPGKGPKAQAQPRMKVALDTEEGVFHVAAEVKHFAKTPDPRLEILVADNPVETLELGPLDDHLVAVAWRFDPSMFQSGRPRFKFSITADKATLRREFLIRYLSEDAVTLTSYGAPLQALDEIYQDRKPAPGPRKHE
jgi:glycosyltransferase involved in cell wall biosynthesis